MIFRDRSTEEWILLSISGLGAISILPFSVLRLIEEEWLLAALDSFAVVAMASIFLYVYLTGRAVLMAHLLSLICLLVLVVTVSLKGAAQTYWTYPAVLVVFFLLRPALALASVLLVIAALTTLLVGEMPPLIFAAFLLSVLATIGFTAIFAWRTRAHKEQLLRLATKDPLTGAGNRRAMEEKLLECLHSYQRTPLPMSLILLDLDNFKAVNDKFGHEEGDRILKAVTRCIQQRLRRIDQLYRFGGEEFVVITENTSLREAGLLAEALRQEVADASAELNAVTISLGVAQYHPGETGYEWLGRADRCMYQAKGQGRNSLCICNQPDQATERYKDLGSPTK
ncbi:GGDEF domain-containing protein [Bowmanella dokdonensis]|uniref:diguanylate cyclase n=1 Tax=Bowmanella dokdonensis TaxID=751969 RepID=A0A939DP52_9ALTE|nr:GGDEF domain-containing protein [Bowmanella dokdonensis]MBN7825381.1 GGDEF domain-containing protein [Bowmanella dokdonensis]